ncbi:MAG: c-type cytochrome [Nitrospirales bacterium]
MRVFLGLLVGTISLSLLGMAGIGQDYAAGHSKGKAIYENYCFRCHGVNGEGDGSDAETLTVPPANFQSIESRMKSEHALRSSVVWGLAFSPMHKWFDKLTPEEMRAVVQYIRQIAPFQAKPN